MTNQLSNYNKQESYILEDHKYYEQKIDLGKWYSNTLVCVAVGI